MIRVMGIVGNNQNPSCKHVNEARDLVGKKYPTDWAKTMSAATAGALASRRSEPQRPSTVSVPQGMAPEYLQIQA